MKSFVAAYVTVIVRKSGEVNYDLFLSLSQDGLRHDDYTDALLGQVTGTLGRNELREIDVSAIFSDPTPALVPGMDYISLFFRANNQGSRGRHDDDSDSDSEWGRRSVSRDVQVVGLRFQYEGNAVVDDSLQFFTVPGTETAEGVLTCSCPASTQLVSGGVVCEVNASVQRSHPSLNILTPNIWFGLCQRSSLDIDLSSGIPTGLTQTPESPLNVICTCADF